MQSVRRKNALFADDECLEAALRRAERMFGSAESADEPRSRLSSIMHRALYVFLLSFAALHNNYKLQILTMALSAFHKLNFAFH